MPKRLASWLLASMPAPTHRPAEERVDLAQPVPVYITYLTAGADNRGVTFRPDRYDRDPGVLARYFGNEREYAVNAR